MEPKSTVLIVDDEPIGRELLSDLLSPLGYDLVFAENGQTALAKAAATTPDLVLLDVMMPDMDGFEVCRKLRANPKLAEVPIILLTALDDRDSRLYGLEAGADEFLSKPFDRTELRTRVRTITRLNRYRRLLAERSKFERVIELSPDGILVVDSETTVHLANPSFCQMLRRAEGSLQGHQAACLIAPDYRERFVATLQSALADDAKVVLLDTEFLRAHEDRFPAELTARYFPWDGKPAVQIHVRDVTEKKILENQFLRAQRLQSIGALAGGIAHDLNNVLTPISVATQILRSAVKEPIHLRLIENLQTSAQRGANIIKQILAFARGVEGEHKPIEVKYLIYEIEKISSDIFPPSIQIRTRAESKLPLVCGDATQLHQVLMNLCVNARDAMAKGGLLKIEADEIVLDEIQAAYYTGATAGRYVKISVTDTGTGIAPEVLPKLFDPFFTTKELGKGTGLGLTTVQSIVKNHGGFLNIESELGKGSRFTAYLPAANHGERSGAESQPKELPYGKGETILLADDEVAILEITKATLERFGYTVRTASDGAEAVAVYAQCQAEIQLVLTDSLMPFLGGAALVHALQKLNPNLNLIVMTTPGARDQLSEINGAASITYLLKPFTPEALLTSLHQALKG